MATKFDINTWLYYYRAVHVFGNLPNSEDKTIKIDMMLSSCSDYLDVCKIRKCIPNPKKDKDIEKETVDKSDFKEFMTRAVIDA